MNIAMSEIPETCDPPNLSEIQSFFYGQCVFLTGVTGLLGKVILEKLLRCCPGIGTIYLHVRGKKDLTPEERLEKLLNSELFKYMKEVLPEYKKKVKLIEGDIKKPRLGISSEDYEEILQNVSIVIHSAASVNFLQPIRKAVEQNVIPVLYLIEMCSAMPRIKAVVHVSTIYTKREPDGTVLEEVPKLQVTPFQLLEALEWMNEKCEESVTRMLTGEKGNNYMVTKALAERVYLEKGGNLPVAIVRPGYIFSTFREPFPGWSDVLQGIPGIAFAIAKGVLRSARFVKNLKFNLIPLDVATNTVIAAAWHAGTTRPANIFIVNCALEMEKMPEMSNIVPLLEKSIRKYPLKTIFRYPDITIHNSKIPHYIHAFFAHYVVAFIVDFLLFIFTGKTILTKTYHKMHILIDIFNNMSEDLWIARLDNFKMLTSKLSPEDSKIFFMNIEGFNLPDYIDKCVYGGRQFLSKEEPSSLPYARKQANIWWIVTTTMKWIIIFYFVYYISTRFVFEKIMGEKMFRIQIGSFT